MRKRGRRKRGDETDRKDSERGRRIISSLSENPMCEGRGEERLQREGTENEERREFGLLSNLAAHRLVGDREKRSKAEERRIRGDQTERERPGRNDKKRGELLSNLPVNRCNRCNQLCLQVKRGASQHQSQQSASGWGQGLRKLLCRGAACNSVIRPVHGSVIQMSRCPAITPAQNDRGTEQTHKNTEAGKEDGLRDEEQRNLRTTEIRAVQDAKENVCNLVISRVSFPCGDTAREPEVCLVPAPYKEAACDPTISMVPAPFSETACSQRQTIPAGHGNPVLGPAPRCSAQQIETQLRIRSACADMILPCDAISKEVMLKGAATAGKRKSEPLEAGETPRKKRKRGRRHARRVTCALKMCAQGQKRTCVGLTSGLGANEASCMQDPTKLFKLNNNESGTFSDNHLSGNSTEFNPEGNRSEENTDCQFLCGTKHSQHYIKDNSEETFNCNAADKLNTYCHCGDSDGGNCNTNDNSQFSSDASGDDEKLKCWTDSRACDTPSDHSQFNRAPNRDEIHDVSGTCSDMHDNPCDKNVKDNPSCDRDRDHSPDHVDRDKPTCNTVDLPLKDSITCSTNTQADHCQYKDKQTENVKISCDVDSSSDSDKTTDFIGEAAAQDGKTELQRHTENKSNLSDSAVDNKTCISSDQNAANGCDDIDSGQSNYFNDNHVTDCNHCANVVVKSSATEAVPFMNVHSKRREEERDVERDRKEEEERQLQRKKVKEKQEEWEKEWVRRKAREKEDRERRKEIDFEHLYPEKRPCFPHALPPHCIPLHPPLLLPPPLSSSSSSFSFHHTIIQRHLSLLPPPAHLPVHSYPHLLPSFSPHLTPLTVNPPPAPPPPPPPIAPSFYASSPIPLLDAPSPFPLASAFHPLQSHHPPLYPPPHPAVVPLQMLF